LRIIIMAAIIAACGGIIVLSAPVRAWADECPSGYYWSKSHGNCVERPDNNPVGAVAICGDGKYSHSESRSGTCSENGGVKQRCPCGDAAGDAAAPPTTLVADPGLDANDRAFIRALRGAQISVDDESRALFGAHWVCGELGHGNSPGDVVVEVKGRNPTLTDLGATDFVSNSVAFYCPQ
jgi:Protein of unknown function (DUF732)/Protein of unknown function (DUF3761)